MIRVNDDRPSDALHHLTQRGGTLTQRLTRRELWKTPIVARLSSDYVQNRHRNCQGRNRVAIVRGDRHGRRDRHGGRRRTTSNEPR